ncbi:MAG: DUF4357 domain-containing protein [Janthinobacterium lividum]
MIEAIQSIREHLIAKDYHNEEHVRFSLVGRILHQLGWNIWDPRQVYTEFKPVKTEDNTKVDIALFAGNYSNDTVFIECKAVGKVNDDLAKVEMQLRDYNRNNTALFTIITDGQIWRFYFSFAGGEFSQKLFKILDIANDSIEDLEQHFQSFLSKPSIFSGNAKSLAQDYLNLSQKEKAMKDSLPEAEKLIAMPPFLSLPDALVSLLNKKGLPLTREEAIAFLQNGVLKNQSNALTKAVPTLKKEISVNTPVAESENLTWTLKLSSGVLAKGELIGSRMRVQKGSTAAIATQASLTGKYVALRKELLKKGVLIENNSHLEFTQDFEFESPAQAAVIICGYSVSAPMYWRTAENVMMRDALAAK